MNEFMRSSDAFTWSMESDPRLRSTVVTVMLPAGVKILSVSRASLTDIKPDSFVGTAATPRPDGTLKALEVHIFAPSLRGSGEGFRPWQGAAGATGTMTNGTVGTTSGSMSMKMAGALSISNVIVSFLPFLSSRMPSPPLLGMTLSSMAFA